MHKIVHQSEQVSFSIL